MKLKGKIVDINLDYLTHRPKITLQLTKQEDILTDEFDKLTKEEVLDIDIVKEVKKRGLQANKYFHSLINELATYNRGTGYAISDDEMKININLSYGTLARGQDGQVLGAKVPKGTDLQYFYPYCKWYKEEDNCDCYLFYKRTSELNSKEFWQLIKGLEVECQKVGIKTLEEKEFEKMMEEYEKEFQRRNK